MEICLWREDAITKFVEKFIGLEEQLFAVKVKGNHNEKIHSSAV